MNRPPRPEVLSPAGDPDALRAAIQAGADAVYFGLQGFNARARATNFDAASLRDTMDLLHSHGVRGYVTLNTLVFDAELPAVESALRACAAAGVDAVIAQDLAVVRLARAIAPELPVHASTQMTCTDAGAVEFAADLGASRVILARELSLDDIAKVRAATSIPIEVFVHGALCVAYSGQCLTSEAIGGRSANRGACAQACRLPYTLVVDGEVKDTGDRAFLLSPEDLEASALIPQLTALGVASVKIEGRLKADSYVAATAALYRQAVDAAADGSAAPDEATRARALQMFTRGSGPGFLAGVDHQRLVDGSTCDHRGLRIATLRAVERMGGRTWLRLGLDADLARGDGLLVQGGRGNEGEVGGRVWAITAGGLDVERAPAGADARVWLGPDRDASAARVGHAVWRTNAPADERAVRDALQHATSGDVVDLVLSGRVGEPARLEGTCRSGRRATVEGDAPIEAGRHGRTPDDVVRDKLGRLGATTLRAGSISNALDDDAMVSPSALNRLRRALVEALAARVTTPWATTDASAAGLLSAAVPPDRAPAPAGLFVLCRTLLQAHAAVDAGADGVYLDFLELTGTGPAVRALRDRGVRHVALAPPRIRKPGEEKIDRYLASLAPDALLVRGLGALHEAGSDGIPRIGDASLNVTNRVTAATVLSRGLSSFTPSFDLDAGQVMALLESPFGPWSELVVHHPMPLFHMEHCVFAAELSTGHTHLDCGRPCDRHRVSLRDRAGMEHPVEADVGCRNTVFHAAAQSAAGLVANAKRAGAQRYRIELVRESTEDVARIVDAYRRLLLDQATAAEVWNTLKAEAHYGVVRGSLRVLAD